MGKKVLLIEDDNRIRDLVTQLLSTNGYEVFGAPNATDGLNHLNRDGCDLVVLDLMLPDMDGLLACQKIRAKSAVPVLMLTAKGDPMDRVIGLEVGADDYLAKPFEPRELLARIKALLRRAGGFAESQELQFGSLRIDLDAMSVTLAGQRVELTAHQFKILNYLAENAGRVRSRDQIMQALAGHDADVFDRSIDVHISKIRNEIEADPKKPLRLLTVRGAGYVFAKNQD